MFFVFFCLILQLFFLQLSYGSKLEPQKRNMSFKEQIGLLKLQFKLLEKEMELKLHKFEAAIKTLSQDVKKNFESLTTDVKMNTKNTSKLSTKLKWTDSKLKGVSSVGRVNGKLLQGMELKMNSYGAALKTLHEDVKQNLKSLSTDVKENISKLSTKLRWTDSNLTRVYSNGQANEQLIQGQSGIFALYGYPKTPSWPATKRITFNPPFSSTPTIVHGVVGLDSKTGYNLRFEVKTSSVSRTGFTLKLRTWANTVLYGFGVRWMACR